ncbi:MAG: hypothetical protein GVY30_09980 [Chloroflexi bacterium]|jgi:hypothetical protein|nr:hypothetical protein [Chloroflexota bacterium]
MTAKPIQAAQSRLPSKQKAYEFFSFCIFLVQTWAIYSLLREMPSLLLRYTVWDIVGAASYTFAFTLLESLGLFAIFYLLTILLPAPILKDEFIIRAVLIFFLINYLAMAFLLTTDQILPWSAGLVGLLGLGYFIVKYKKIRSTIAGGMDRLSVLATIYLVVDILSVLIVLVRNLS